MPQFLAVVSELVEPIKQWSESVISSMGYPGITLLMALDCANIPIPSEVIMPFGGMIAWKGELDLHLVALSGTLGSVIGSAASYGLGAAFGKEFFLKYGKYVLLRPKEVELAEKWFDKYGLKATLFLRCVPIARTFISLPAGIYKANFWVFLLYSLLGSLPWCYLWATIGYKLGENWSKAQDHIKILDYIVLAILVYLLYRFLRYRFKRAAETTSEAS